MKPEENPIIISLDTLASKIDRKYRPELYRIAQGIMDSSFVEGLTVKEAKDKSNIPSLKKYLFLKEKEYEGLDNNWQEYVRMMDYGELDHLKGRHAAFTNGKFMYAEKTEKELIERLNAEGVESETMTQLIGGGLQTVEFRRPKRVAIE